MKKGETKENTAQRIDAYLDGRIVGTNKQDSALEAGYNASTARNPSLIEHTQAYAVAVTEILGANTLRLRNALVSLDQDMQNGLFDMLSPKTKVDIAYKLAQIHDILTPKVTVKETQNKDGTVTRTLWGTNGSPQLGTQE